MKNIVPLIALFLVLVSCEERTIPDDGTPYNSKLVVNSLIDNESEIKAYVSRSVSSLSGNSPSYISDAEVYLKENGTVVDTLQYDAVDNYYFGQVRPVLGSTYEINVTDKLLGNAYGTASLPNSVNFSGLSYQDTAGYDSSGSPLSSLTISFTDPGGVSNFYKLDFLYYSNVANAFLPFEFNTDDNVLLSPSTQKLAEGGYLFNDVLFNGEDRKIKVTFPQATATGTPKYIVRFEILSEEAFRYLDGIERFANQDNNSPLNQPVFIYSNIRNGLGIFAGSYIERDTIY